MTGCTIKVDVAATRYAVMTGGFTSSQLSISNSHLLANDTTLHSTHLSIYKASSSALKVATSLVDSASTGSPVCVHVYDSNYNDLNNVCPAPIS